MLTNWGRFAFWSLEPDQNINILKIQGYFQILLFFLRFVCVWAVNLEAGVFRIGISSIKSKSIMPGAAQWNTGILRFQTDRKDPLIDWLNEFWVDLLLRHIWTESSEVAGLTNESIVLCGSPLLSINKTHYFNSSNKFILCKDKN